MFRYNRGGINMKKPKTGETIGIFRRLDDLGRIVLPNETRKYLNINPGDLLEIFSLQDGFYIRKVIK